MLVLGEQLNKILYLSNYALAMARQWVKPPGPKLKKGVLGFRGPQKWAKALEVKF
jgi:hypothetical protein